MANRTEMSLQKGLQQLRIGAYRLILSQRSVYRALRAAVSPNLFYTDGGEPVSAERFKELGADAEVIAYFADTPARAYQLRQWTPVLEQLAERRRVLVVLRNLDSFNFFRDLTSLPLVFARRLRDLEDVLESADPSVCLYVNNSTQNFQPLSWRRALHVHLNHGESDKVSMASNQAKAYDVVFVAGEAAERRYLDNLIAFDGDRLVRTGRPQLDVELPRVLGPASRRTVMYAPTWEGDTPAMDYTSLGRYGVPLVEGLLAHGGFRIVYKPHPRVVQGSPPVVGSHERILKLLAQANGSLPPPERHVVEMEEDILPLFGACDALLSDVSSVALDWLYLRTESPLWLFDPYDDRDRLVRASPLAASVGVIDSTVIEDVAAVIDAGLESDPHGPPRQEARRFYFGDLERGESTRRFLEAVDEVITRRDVLLGAKESAGGVEVEAGLV